MNPLLARQLRKHLPDVDSAAAPWRDFLTAVDAAYGEFAQDHAFLEHTLEVTSAELTEANERLRQENENRLASLSRYYQQTLELQQGMILCVRRTPRGFEHTLCRGQLALRLGLTAEQIEGRLVDEIAPPRHAAQLNAGYTRAWEGEEHSFMFTTSEGTELFVLMRPRCEKGQVQEVIASCVEITALKKAEAELRSAKERAEAADRAKSEFLAVMSHEIRTPLNAVLGFASLLRETPLNEEQRSWLGTIGTSGESLLALINDILDFSKIEAGHLTLDVHPVTVVSILEEMTHLFAPRAQEKNITFTIALGPEVPPIINTDVQRLRQVLINLVGNAVKFTERGSVWLRVSCPTGRGAAPNGGERQIFFSVQDTGIGIPPDRRDRLFKPFSQVDSSTTRHYGGTGLGLAICHRLVHLLGGSIDVTSEPGAGSTFSFSIRTTTPAPFPPPAAIAASPAERVNHDGAAHFRILVAEDQAQNRDLIFQVLKTRGYLADVVENGRHAVEAARRQHYHLVLLDLRMPEMDGYEAAAAIREELDGRPAPKIYALTANVFPEDRVRCAKSGMDGILTKPLQFKELFGTIAAIQAEQSPQPG